MVQLEEAKPAHAEPQHDQPYLAVKKKADVQVHFGREHSSVTESLSSCCLSKNISSSLTTP